MSGEAGDGQGRVEWSGAVACGERGCCREPSCVSNLAEQSSGADSADPDDGGEGGAGCFDEAAASRSNVGVSIGLP